MEQTKKFVETTALTSVLSPGERMCAITVSGFRQTVRPIPPLDFSKRRNVILPLLGEKAGMRMDEKTNCRVFVLGR